ncbi:hypothetical protein [Corallococcus sp. AB038B]|uniref:5'-methylthioadenosine/S-adenosylhomocysteine nucleosidase family protein n=1 Tax=Corallococcus sp. AB038B TaxID=2316718 RepID=UPI000EEEEBAA|nr:hypothetical protein [Corallococcus sp. AB038B]RKH95402.1 hypothetical protein D7Y04_34500 [Corallococcus sp. AB038B]
MALLDFLILLPLDEEFRNVARLLQSGRSPCSRRVGDSYHDVWVAEEDSFKRGRVLHLCAAAAMGRMGQDESAAFAKAACSYWQPAHVILLGIAGSISPEVNLGDVVIPGEAVGYVVASVVGDPPRFEFRHTGHEALGVLQGRARYIRNNDRLYSEWQEACLAAAHKDPYLKTRITRPPEAHAEKIALASGNNVVKARGFAEQLREQLKSNVHAVEMESKGLFVALRGIQSKPEPLLIRGISDLADERKAEIDESSGGAYRTWAAQNAARFLQCVLREPDLSASLPELRLDATPSKSQYRVRKEGLFLRENQNIAFDNILGGGPRQECVFTVEVTRAEYVAPLMPQDQIKCLLHTAQHIKQIPPRASSETSSFILEASETQERLEVLLSLCTPKVEAITFRIKNDFGQTQTACWTPKS